jgi:tetratricopeptide (TPR) repeat protein
MLKAFLFYLRIVFIPAQLRIGYRLEVERDLAGWPLMGLLAIIGLAFFASVQMRKRPAIAFGVGWFFIFLLPVSNIIPIRVLVGERLLYLPLAGWAIAIAGLAQLFKERFKVFAAICCAAIILLSCQTAARIGVWLDEETFWKDAIRKDPASPQYKQALAVHYFNEKRFVESERLFAELSVKYPDDARIVENLAKFYFNAGEYSKALPLFLRLLALEPDNPTYTTGVRLSRKRLGQNEQ